MAKYLPHGTTVSVNSQAIGGLISVSIPDRTRGEAETTDSDSGFDREFIPALRDPGSVELTFRHDPEDAGQLELNENFDDDGDSAVVPVTITLPSEAGSNRVYSFDAFVTAPPQGDLGLVEDEAAEQTATLRVAGPVSFT